MPITELQCPRCGTAVKMGLPMGATVQSVTAATDYSDSDDGGEGAEADDDGDDGDDDDGGESAAKVRALRCQNDHEFAVRFQW